MVVSSHNNEINSAYYQSITLVRSWWHHLSFQMCEICAPIISLNLAKLGKCKWYMLINTEEYVCMHDRKPRRGYVQGHMSSLHFGT